MKWKEFTLETTTGAEEAVTALLNKEGIYDLEIIDGKKETGLDPWSDSPELRPDHPYPDDGTAKVRFYLKPDEDWGGIIGRLKLDLDSIRPFIPVGPGTITVDETEDVDWENNWKKFFHGMKIGDLTIAPTWEDHPELTGEDRCIRIDPGLAFGTGGHETTRLILSYIEDYIRPGDRVLDVGTGSGILIMAAILYGAGECTGTDIDPMALTTVRENLKTNGMEGEGVRLFPGDLTGDSALREKLGEGYTAVFMNLLADILIPMAVYIFPLVKEKGHIFLSGIILEREAEVEAAYQKAGFVLKEETTLGEWAGIVMEKQ